MHRFDLLSLQGKNVEGFCEMSHEMIHAIPDAKEIAENRMAEDIARYIIRSKRLDIDTTIDEYYGGLQYTARCYVLNYNEMQELINEVVWKTLAKRRMPFFDCKGFVNES